MQVGSLIFLAIVATWAVYLLQHWIRRREEAAATRSADRYTGAMRVLEKRVPTASVMTPDSPFVARRAPQTQPRRTAEVATMSSTPTPTRTPTPTHAGTPRQSSGHQVPVERAPSAGRPRVSRWRRQVRGVVLLMALLWVPVSIVLAAVHVLLWISVPLALLTLAAVLVWLRFEARADRARSQAQSQSQSQRRLARPPAARPAARPSTGSTRPGGAAPRRPRPAPRATDVGRAAAPADDTEVIHLAGRAVAATGTETAAPAGGDEPARADGAVGREARSAAYDFEAELARDTAAAPTPQPAPEGSWSPVPVPPPTYTMKAKAEPRMTSAGVPADVFATPEFAEEAEELDERALFARRAAGS